MTSIYRPEFTEQEVNLLLRLLGQHPHDEVRALIDKVIESGKRMVAETDAARFAEIAALEERLRAAEKPGGS